MSTTFYKALWQPLLHPGWKAGLGLLLLWSVPRFFIVLNASRDGNYQWVSLLFISMWIAPYILLTREGGRAMGIKKPERYYWLPIAALAGFLACALMFVLAIPLFGRGEENWLAYISQSYTNLPAELSADTRFTFFLIFSAIGITFSPIGEELFYRGLIHENFRFSLNQRWASILDSLAFALVHLAHFGIVYQSDGFRFLLLPGLYWISCLFLLCLSFSWFRQRAGSVLGAIVAHAGFNLGMNYFIFYHLLTNSG